MYAVRVFDSSGKGYASDIARGIIEAVRGPDGVVGTEDDADVISMSFGGPSSSVVYDAIRYAYTAGAVLVAASGNSGGSTVCPWIFIFVCLCSFVSRDFHLAHTDIGICMGSWVAVEPNGTGLPSSSSPGGLEQCSHHHRG
ncbi:MAG: S8 family serine peptidase, partial [Sulfolobales archaeon]